MRRKRYTLPCLFLFTILLGFNACQKSVKGVEIELDEFEVKDHILIGQSLKEQIAKMPEVFNLLDSAEYKNAYGYLTTLMQTLKLTKAVKHRKDFNWNINIIHDDQIKNAFTLPGGHIYIYTGLLKFLEAEHELIAVLGNEIAYADKELSIKTLREIFGGVVLGDITLGNPVPDLPDMAEAMPTMQFRDTIVHTADMYSIDLICPFQYDITGLESFVQRAQTHQIDWIKSKKREDLSKRLKIIKEASSSCGEGGVTNLEAYRRFIKNYLP